MARGSEQPAPIGPRGLCTRLYRRYGDLGWWPAEGPFEVMVGAVLTQRTSWTNVERALRNLKMAGIDTPRRLMALPEGTLEALVRPSGTYRQKARRLRALFALVEGMSGGSLETFLDRPASQLREDLLGLPGIGPETADSIILYAAKRPVFVVDAYTRRILERLGVEAGRTYEEVAAWFTAGLPEDVGIFNNLHAMLVLLGKEHCRKRPSCPGCPLGDVCLYKRTSALGP